MRLHKTKTQGFTVAELLIVIVVLGILTSASIMGYTSIQRDGRDKLREQNITIIVEALEKYYDKNGQYPTMADMRYVNSDNQLTKLLKLKDYRPLVMPGAPSSTRNSFGAGTATVNKPLYTGTPNASHCTSSYTPYDNGYCTGYTVTWISERDPEHPITVTSRR